MAPIPFENDGLMKNKTWYLKNFLVDKFFFGNKLVCNLQCKFKGVTNCHIAKLATKG